MTCRETRRVDGCVRETEALHPELVAWEATIDSRSCQLIQGRQDAGKP